MRHLLIIFALLFVMGAPVLAPVSAWADEPAQPASSPAEGELQTVDPEGNILKCSTLEGTKGGGLLGMIVPCLQYTVESSTIRFTAAMVDWLRPLLYVFLGFVIVILGIRIAMQEPNIHKHGFLLLFKVAMVITILDAIPTYLVPQVYNVMNESQAIIVDALDVENSSFKCEVGKYSGASDQIPKVWAAMDCVVGKLFGFTMGEPASAGGEQRPNMVLVTSMFGLLTGFFFGGAWGVVVFFGMIGVLLSVFMLVVRVVMAYLQGYLMACLMLIICPLLMPLIFMNVTKNYFDGVIKNIFGAFVMPILITSYAMFALMIYDKMLFADTSILQKLFDYSKTQEAVEAARQVCSNPVMNDPTKQRKDVLEELKKKYNPLIITANNPLTAAGNEPCEVLPKVAGFNTQQVDDPEFKKGRETFVKLFTELMQLFVLAFLIHGGLSGVIGMVGQLTGASTTAMVLKSESALDIKVSEAMKSGKESMMRAAGMKKGAEAMTGMREGIRDGMYDMFKVLKGDSPGNRL